MVRTRILLTLPFALALSAPGALADEDARLAAEAQALDAKPSAEFSEQGLFLSAPAVTGFQLMEVRVYDADNQLVFRERTAGSSVSLLASGLPDGEYFFQAVSLYRLAVPYGQGADYEDSGSSREAGHFVIRDGALYHQEDLRNPNAANGLLDQALDLAAAAVAYSVGWLVTDAAADFTITDTEPALIFDDSSDAGTDWEIEGSSTFNNLRIRDLLGTNSQTVVQIDGQPGSGFNNSSWIVQSDGDMFWGDSVLYFDRGAETLSLGWTSTETDFSISASTPDFRLHDTSGTQEFEIQLTNELVQFWGRENDAADWTSIFEMYVDAPADSLLINSNGNVIIGDSVDVGSALSNLTLSNSAADRAQLEFVSEEGSAFIEYGQGDRIDFERTNGEQVVSFAMGAPLSSLVVESSGEIGLGTSAPTASLEVSRSDGSAQILVDENNVSPAPRTLFKLQNAGNTKFEIEETDTGVLWAFTNSGVDFRVSRQGSGEVEFAVDNNGNATLAGTLTQNSDVNAKQAIVPVDSRQILHKVVALPISQWQYRDSAGENHIGPMAQDFYAAFALGGTSTGISSIDTGGVALAAIQALAAENDALVSENAELRERLEAVEQRQASMELAMTRLLENTAGTMLHTGGVKN